MNELRRCDSCAEPNVTMRMNSPQGKEILSLLRDADYAHAGEAEAIDRVFAGLPRDPARAILDVGCGRGGTAAYVRRQGYGRVTGIDIDVETLAHASTRYSEVNFVPSDAASVDRHWNSHFDLVYLFNSFYAFQDQTAALNAIASAARHGGRLWIFDYARWSDRNSGLPQTLGSPLIPANLPLQFESAGWQLEQVEDLSQDYHRWYEALVDRILASRDQIETTYGRAWYSYTLATYADLLLRIETGDIGGAIVRAIRLL